MKRDHLNLMRDIAHAQRERAMKAEARVAELEGANARMREAIDHKCLNSIEKLATIATILTTV